MTAIGSEIRSDLLELFSFAYLPSGIRITQDTKCHFYFRSLMMFISAPLGLIGFMQHRDDFIFLLARYIWHPFTPLLLYCLQHRLPLFLNQVINTKFCIQLNYNYFRSKIITSKRIIFWIILIDLLYPLYRHIKYLFQTIESAQFILIFDVLSIMYSIYGLFVILIAEYTSLYFGFYFRYLFNAIKIDIAALNDKPEDVIMDQLQGVQNTYQQMTEFIADVEYVISPIILIMTITFTPSIIISIPRAEINDPLFCIGICILVFIFLAISWISVYYAAPYDAVYQLSFNCSSQRLEKVTTQYYNIA